MARSGRLSTPDSRCLHTGGLRRLSDAIPVAQRGESLVEFTLVVPVILLLVLSIMQFGILFEDKIAMNNAARDGVRWATQYPGLFDNASPPNPDSIQGQIVNEGGTVTIPNDNSHINISYYTVSYDSTSGSPTSTTLCGYYDATSTGGLGGGYFYYSGSTTPTANVPTWSSWAPQGTTGSSFSDSQCLVAGNLIQVTVTKSFQLSIPIISRIFPNGVTLSASATMTEENSGS